MIIVLWGVSGCGKTTVGRLLAKKLQCAFYDADDFHSESNIEKMREGIPLSDEDRWPWLATIAGKLKEILGEEGAAVLACSALRQAYRDALSVEEGKVRFVQLSGSYGVIAQRLAQRQHEFMRASLLQSQFDTLETPSDGIVADVEATPEDICQFIIAELGAPPIKHKTNNR